MLHDRLRPASKAIKLVLMLVLTVELLAATGYAEPVTGSGDDEAGYVQCLVNLENIAKWCSFFRAERGRNPSSLDELADYLRGKSFPTVFLRCPISGENYNDAYRDKGQSISVYCAGESHKAMGFGANLPRYPFEPWFFPRE